jgi:hypothetical protein
MATIKIYSESAKRKPAVSSGSPWQQQQKNFKPGRKDTHGRPARQKPGTIHEIHHTNRRTSVTPVARASPSGVSARAKAGIRGMGGDSDASRKTPRRFNLGKFGFNPKAPSGYQNVLMGEMVVAFVIIGIRAIADYNPSNDFRAPGSEQPKKGASPISLIASTLAIYFVLAFLATRGGWPARVASAFGLLMIVGLMINSEAELAQVATWVEAIGTNGANQPPIAPPSGSSGNSSAPAAPPQSRVPLVPASGPGSVGQPLS